MRMNNQVDFINDTISLLFCPRANSVKTGDRRDINLKLVRVKRKSDTHVLIYYLHFAELFSLQLLYKMAARRKKVNMCSRNLSSYRFKLY